MSKRRQNNDHDKELEMTDRSTNRKRDPAIRESKSTPFIVSTGPRT